jgi:hypothetical protein
VTARAIPKERPDGSLRVVKGRKLRKPVMAPWMVVVLIATAAFLGLGFARTSLDRTAFDLAELNRQIVAEEARNLDLRLKFARMESPARVAPLAEQLGLLIPHTVHQLMADLDRPFPVVARAEERGTN